MSDPNHVGWLTQLRERGVLRVAASYAVIAWLLLQIADVTFEPMGMPAWAMPSLIVAALLGFPVALLLAWFLELGDQGVSRDTAAADQPRPRVHGLRRYADVLVIGGLLAVVGVLLVKDSDLGRPAPPPEPAIAVLPFENLSGDPEQAYFSDGLAEEMLDRLGRVPGLKVIARASSFDFRGGSDVTEIAARLGVTTLLAGSVRRDGTRLRLTARLLDGATGQQLWSDSFDRELHDVFAVQAELAGAVVDALVPAARGELALDPAPPTTSLDAYDLYLAARAQLPLRIPEAIEKAVALGEAVVRLDPDFARGQAHLANALIFQVLFFDDVDPERSPERLKRAEAAIYKALSLEPDLSEAHGAYANLLRETGRPGAEEEYRRALELNPNNASTWHDYAFFLSRFPERRDDSFKATARSLELDPRQPNAWANYLGHLGGPYNPRFREAFARALRAIGDIPFALDRITLPDLSLMGFPVQVAEAAVIKARSPAPQNLPVWINLSRAWLPVDPVRAASFLPAEAGFRQGPSVRPIDMEAIRLFVDADLAGLAGDWRRLESRWAELDARPGVTPGTVAGVKAFWTAVRGRDDEAAAWLARAEPIPETFLPPVMGSSNDYGLMDTMRLHILRATGRGEETTRQAEARLALLREQREALGEGCGEPVFAGWISLAGIAAVEGLRDEAVDALAGALRCGDLPPGFNPDWPWFRALDGYPPYEALKKERLERIERIRAELLRIETESGLAEALKRAASPPG